MHIDDARARLAAARAGDAAARSALVAAFGDHVLAAVRAEMGDALRARHEAEDLAQDVWERALRSLDAFRGETEAALRAWLASMAAHVAMDHARRARARGAGRDVPLAARDSSASGGGAGAAGLAASAPSPSRVLRRRERSDRLEAALDALSEDHRRVIRLARLEGLPVSEVAARMGRSPNATSMLLLRALRELKARFGKTESLSLPRPENEDGDGR